jgi:hypothetical protein
MKTQFSWFNVAISIVGAILLFGTCFTTIILSDKQNLAENQQKLQEFCGENPVQITNIYSQYKITYIVVKYQAKEIVVTLGYPKPIHIGEFWYLKATTCNIIVDKKYEK